MSRDVEGPYRIQGAAGNHGKYDVVIFQLLSSVQLFVTPWTVACQAPLSMGFSR